MAAFGECRPFSIAEVSGKICNRCCGRNCFVLGVTTKSVVIVAKNMVANVKQSNIFSDSFYLTCKFATENRSFGLYEPHEKSGYEVFCTAKAAISTVH